MSILQFPFHYDIEEDTFLEPYNDEYKDTVKQEVKQFLAVVGDAYKIKTINCSSHSCSVKVISKANLAYKPKETEALQPVITTHFEEQILGVTKCGYSVDYGWGEDIREFKAGDLADYFRYAEKRKPVTDMESFKRTFFRWLTENNILGDPMEGNVIISFEELIWEDEEMYR